jgi:hypothetical protein
MVPSITRPKSMDEKPSLTLIDINIFKKFVINYKYIHILRIYIQNRLPSFFSVGVYIHMRLFTISVAAYVKCEYHF